MYIRNHCDHKRKKGRKKENISNGHIGNRHNYCRICCVFLGKKTNFFADTQIDFDSNTVRTSTICFLKRWALHKNDLEQSQLQYYRINIGRVGATAYQLGNTSSRRITEVKQR